MGYKTPYYGSTQIESSIKVEGEPIEHKIERVVSNGEPIKDGAPLVYTERKDGVNAAYNIRTDRWEIAADAMDAVHKAMIAKRDHKGVNPEGKEAKVVKLKKEDSGAESTNGTTD
jgi:hypothetical protein